MTTIEPVKQIIRRAQLLLLMGWTQGNYAVDKDGISVDPTSNDACKFCATGALRAAAFELGYSPLLGTSDYSGDTAANDAFMHLNRIVSAKYPHRYDASIGFPLVELNDGALSIAPILEVFLDALK